MSGVLVAVVLIASLMLVHVSIRARPMPSSRPLNVDGGLPFPEAAQASTVFSLTALFGAYFGIFLILGTTALAGLATGTALGLFFVRRALIASEVKSFEGFLEKFAGGDTVNAAVVLLFAAAVQCAYATSELLILREIAQVAFGARADHATLLALGAAIVGYFYILFGGYAALFKTDVIQFVLAAAMGLVLSYHLDGPAGSPGLRLWLLPRPGYWTLPMVQTGSALYVYHFLVGLIMGFGFIAASPDAWKRIFVIPSDGGGQGRRFTIFLIAGIVPFALLVPLASKTPSLPDGPVGAARMFSALFSSDFILVTATLGLIASFLSAFNGGLLTSVQLGLIAQRLHAPARLETPRFHWLMACALVTIFLLFAVLRTSGNPYLLANILLGPYALAAGIVAGTGFSLAKLPDTSAIWIVAAGSVSWLAYFVSHVERLSVPNTFELNTVPGGAALFLITAGACRLLTLARRTSA